MKNVAEKRGDHWEPNGGGSSGSSSSSGDDEPTKQELYEKAKDLDVEGRSDMSKHELAKPVEKES